MASSHQAQSGLVGVDGIVADMMQIKTMWQQLWTAESQLHTVLKQLEAVETDLRDLQSTSGPSRGSVASPVLARTPPRVAQLKSIWPSRRADAHVIDAISEVVTHGNSLKLQQRVTGLKARVRTLRGEINTLKRSYASKCAEFDRDRHEATLRKHFNSKDGDHQIIVSQGFLVRFHSASPEHRAHLRIPWQTIILAFDPYQPKPSDAELCAALHVLLADTSQVKLVELRLRYPTEPKPALNFHESWMVRFFDSHVPGSMKYAEARSAWSTSFQMLAKTTGSGVPQAQWQVLFGNCTTFAGNEPPLNIDAYLWNLLSLVPDSGHRELIFEGPPQSQASYRRRYEHANLWFVHVNWMIDYLSRRAQHFRVAPSHWARISFSGVHIDSPTNFTGYLARTWAEGRPACNVICTNVDIGGWNAEGVVENIEALAKPVKRTQGSKLEFGVDKLV